MGILPNGSRPCAGCALPITARLASSVARKSAQGGLQCFVLPAEPGQQLAVEFAEIVNRSGPKRLLAVQSAPAFDPRQRFLRFPRCKQSGDCEAVLRFKPGLLSQRDLGLDASLRAVNRAQDAAPAPVLVTGRFFQGRHKTSTTQLLPGRAAMRWRARPDRPSEVPEHPTRRTARWLPSGIACHHPLTFQSPSGPPGVSTAEPSLPRNQPWRPTRRSTFCLAFHSEKETRTLFLGSQLSSSRVPTSCSVTETRYQSGGELPLARR